MIKCDGNDKMIVKNNVIIGKCKSIHSLHSFTIISYKPDNKFNQLINNKI